MTGGTDATILSSSQSPAYNKLPRLARSGYLRNSRGSDAVAGDGGLGISRFARISRSASTATSAG